MRKIEFGGEVVGFVGENLEVAGYSAFIANVGKARGIFGGGGEKFLLFDVREESEYAAGHLPGARSLGKGVIERDIEMLVPDPDQEVVLYCGGGYRSVLAADSLQKMGYGSVISMDGGFRGWKEAKYPIET